MLERQVLRRLAITGRECPCAEQDGVDSHGDPVECVAYQARKEKCGDCGEYLTEDDYMSVCCDVVECADCHFAAHEELER